MGTYVYTLRKKTANIKHPNGEKIKAHLLAFTARRTCWDNDYGQNSDEDSAIKKKTKNRLYGLFLDLASKKETLEYITFGCYETARVQSGRLVYKVNPEFDGIYFDWDSPTDVIGSPTGLILRDGRNLVIETDPVKTFKAHHAFEARNQKAGKWTTELSPEAYLPMIKHKFENISNDFKNIENLNGVELTRELFDELVAEYDQTEVTEEHLKMIRDFDAMTEKYNKAWGIS